MKNKLSLILLLLAITAYGQQGTGLKSQLDANLDSREKIQALIDKGLIENKEEIQKEASSLSDVEKMTLYDENKMNVLGWAALNIFPGFGLGSYVQGDKSSWIKLSIADGVGWAIIIYGRIISPGDCISSLDPDSKKNCDSKKWKDANNMESYSYIAGVVVLAASRVMGCIFPFGYQKEYNKTLNEALNSNTNVSYSIDPLIIPRDGAPAVGLTFSLKY
ncbi:MAG: P13 family porin [Fibromonadaceae bacterium]|jgi:hypothetical protein|nr:P13 family porin [Fibromonadaceae bacterium]